MSEPIVLRCHHDRQRVALYLDGVIWFRHRSTERTRRGKALDHRDRSDPGGSSSTHFLRLPTTEDPNYYISSDGNEWRVMEAASIESKTRRLDLTLACQDDRCGEHYQLFPVIDAARNAMRTGKRSIVLRKDTIAAFPAVTVSNE